MKSENVFIGILAFVFFAVCVVFVFKLQNDKVVNVYVDAPVVSVALVSENSENSEIPAFPEASENVTSASHESYSRKININTASEKELTKLFGIGEVYAARIVEYREENGGFKETSEIMNVKGIGEKLYEKLKDYITV